jgi:cyclic patellamide precursor peptide PatG
MEQNEVNEPSTNQDMARSASITPAQGEVMDSPPAQEMPCPTCAGAAASMPMSYIYALGRIEVRFPRLSVEKEFAQVTGRAETVGKTDQQVFHVVLSKPENRYLARQMCWVLTIQGLETYILQPRDPVDFN